MPRRAASQPTLTSMIGDNSITEAFFSDDEEQMPTPDSAAENRASTKATRAKKAATGAKKNAPVKKEPVKAATKKSAANKKEDVVKKENTATRRKALKEKDQNETMDVDDEAEEEEADELSSETKTVPAAKESKAQTQTKGKGKRSRAVKDDEEEEEEQKPAAKGRKTAAAKGRKTAAAKGGKKQEEQEEERPKAAPKKATRGRPARKEEPVEDVSEIPETQPEPQQKKNTRGRPKKNATTAVAAKREESKRKDIIPETQAPEEEKTEPMDIEESIEIDEDAEQEDLPEPEPEPMRPPPRPAQRNNSGHLRSSSRRDSRQGSRQGLMPLPSTGRRAGSAEASDPLLRRKLGDTNRKLEAVQARYDDLKELAQNDKESNYDKLKRATDQREKDQKAVIDSLKQRITSLQSDTNESKRIHKELESLRSEKSSQAEKLKSQASELKSQSNELKALNKSLQEAQNEIKSLNAKLSSMRTASAEPPKSSQTPGGNGSKPHQRNLTKTNGIVGNDSTLFDLKTKEALYTDITGLLVTSIKPSFSSLSQQSSSTPTDTVYDLLQTGRNGTLHFKLSIPTSETVKDEGWSYDETPFVYSPVLDEGRDKDLMELLPMYLREEIEFRRDQGVRFFSKLVDCMSRNLDGEEGEEEEEDESEEVTEGASGEVTEA